MKNHTATILCVMDNAETLQMLTALLQQEGYRVIADQSKTNAKRKVRSVIFDVIILDVHLSDGTGIEFCNELREAGKQTPILFYTSETNTKYVQEAIKAGAQVYLSPPLYPAVLKESVARLSKASRSK